MPGPSNLYGVANPVILPVQNFVAGPVACSAGVETTVISTITLVAPSSGYFYPIIWFNCAVGFGATPPTGITFAAKIGAGSDFDTYVVGAPALYANSYVIQPVELLGPASNTAWSGAGSIINITCNAAGQAVNLVQNKSLVALFRAPDQ